MGKENFKKNARVFWPLGIFLFVLLVAVDQLSKHSANKIFYNSAFAFSLPVPVLLIYIVYAVVVTKMVFYIFKNYRNFSFISKLAWTFVFAGAASNILERIFLGSVRDFIYITLNKWTGVYNLADGYIIVGIILLLFQSHAPLKNSNEANRELGIRN